MNPTKQQFPSASPLSGSLERIMESYNNFAIDTETLSLTPDAAVIQISIVPFSIQQADILHDRILNLWINPQEYEGREEFTISKEVLQWWATENPMMLAKAGSNGDRIGIALTEISDYLDRYVEFSNIATKNMYLWGQGAGFDFPILENFLFHHSPNKANPFDFRKYRDGRTLWEVVTENPKVKAYLSSTLTLMTKHDARNDAIMLAERVILASGAFRSDQPYRTLVDECSPKIENFKLSA